MATGRWVTSKDVAERAGVSRAAVSAVLNGTRGTIRVSPTTRETILAAAAELGYTPNPVARHLRQRRSGVVALAVPTFEDGLYERTMPYQLSHNVMRVAVEKGRQLVETALLPDDDRVLLALLQKQKVDGVIVGWPETAEQVQRISTLGVPVVQVMKPQPAPGTATVTVDPRIGMREAVRHLSDHGHARIAYLGSGSAHPVEKLRLAAFRDALAAAGRPHDAALVRLAERFSVVEGQQLMEQLLASPAPPTAVIAGDGLVLGALRALYAAGIRIPTEFSIICFDDELAASLYPPLSGIRQPIADIARAAVEHIESVVQGGTDLVDDLSLPTGFTVRGSTGPVFDGSAR